jgi:uncharacterized protein YjiS (DUF1127 family)
MMSQVHALPRHQAHTLYETGLQFARTLLGRWTHYRKVRETYRILAQMDEHQLADIGLNRSMIMNVEELLERGRR